MFNDKLRNIYIELSELSISSYTFCCDKKKSCNCKYLLDNLISALLCKSFNNNSSSGKVNLLESLIFQLDNIESFTCHCKNYSYLAQIQRFSYITKNFKKLVHQIYCLSDIDNCDIISKLFCIILKIINCLLQAISHILNIETSCCLDECCKENVIDNWICSLINQIDCFSILVSDFAKLILEIISIMVSECIDNSNCLYGCKFKY